jgi:anti-sigma B factor antagonist
MQIKEREAESTTVIEIIGEAKARDHYEKLHNLLHDRMSQGRKRFVINLSECRWIDSAGLGELIKTFGHVMREGGSLKLAAAPEKIRNILNITHVTQVIELFETEAAALESFDTI